MQPENVKEYEMIREEMSSVKDCITKYIGFVLGGSGAAIFFIARMGQDSGEKTIIINDFESAFACLALSIIINFVLLILFYKFHSHNRYAGYCKLLNHERHKSIKEKQPIQPPQPREDSSIFAWEVSVGRLRDQDNRKDLLDNKIDIKDIDIQDLGNYIKSTYEENENAKNGINILKSAIFGEIKTKSWAFPPLITAMFCVLSFGFFLVGYYFLVKYLLSRGPYEFKTIFAIVLFATVPIIQVLLWYRLVGKLQFLMEEEGGYTVEAFFWKFMPIRASFLNKNNIRPRYIDAELPSQKIRKRSKGLAGL